MERKHRGTLTDESAEKMKNSHLEIMPGLTCKDCGASVIGVRDFNGHPIPSDHIVAGTRTPYRSGKGRNTKR